MAAGLEEKKWRVGLRQVTLPRKRHYYSTFGVPEPLMSGHENDRFLISVKWHTLITLIHGNLRIYIYFFFYCCCWRWRKTWNNCTTGNQGAFHRRGMVNLLNFHTIEGSKLIVCPMLVMRHTKVRRLYLISINVIFSGYTDLSRPKCFFLIVKITVIFFKVSLLFFTGISTSLWVI